MTYKIERLESKNETPMYVVKYKKAWYTRWKYARSKKDNKILAYSTKRAAQSYINFQKNPRIKAKNS